MLTRLIATVRNPGQNEDPADVVGFVARILADDEAVSIGADGVTISRGGVVVEFIPIEVAPNPAYLLEDLPEGVTRERLIYRNGRVEVLPAPEVALPPVPQVVSPRQARLALNAVGLLDEVEAMMTDPNTPRAVVITWEYAIEFRRNDPLIEQMGATLGLSSAEIDNLFRLAVEL